VHLPELESGFAKVSWGKEHLKRLKGEVGVFLDSQAKGLAVKRDGERRYNLVLHSDPVPALRWGVILGDAVHCLRSGLDHGAWAAVGLDHGGWPEKRRERKRIQFPIYSLESDFTTATILQYLKPLTRAAIEEAQPFFSGDDPALHPLAIINALSNEDKHRVLIPSLFTTDSGSLEITLGYNKDIASIGEFEMVVQHGTPLEQDAVIGSVEAVVIGPNPDMQVEGSFPGFVSFSAEGTPVGLDTLDHLALFANAILYRLDLALQGLVQPE
jgi:hypothetical protein